MKLNQAKAGDQVKVAVGSQTYTKKISSNKKSRSLTVKIKKASAGQKVKVTLYDKFKKKKDSDNTIVYYGNSIYKGMSSGNAVLTTWGSPVRRNSYGSWLQWVFTSGNTTLYAYIKNGKVVSTQKLNY
jgi:hypothetical protein